MQNYSDKTILITGGTGSFGKTILNKYAKNKFKEIRVFSRDEKKQDSLRQKYKDNKIKFIIGDVRDANAVSMALNGVDFVYHAAALKQVPSCEFYPIEAVQTNVMGTKNVLDACVERRVKKVICLSTDKAVAPVNTMGMSKALMEKLVLSYARQETPTSFCLTRYGNVIASRGSVIPRFIEQIKNDQPLTVTNYNMTRFMMTLGDAVRLVEYAFEEGSNGDLFVQKAPGTSISSIVSATKKLFDRPNHREVVIGNRHGEKNYETLLSNEEIIKSKEHEQFFCIPLDGRDLNYDVYFENGNMALNDTAEFNSNNCYQLDVEETAALIEKGIKEVNEI